MLLPEILSNSSSCTALVVYVINPFSHRSSSVFDLSYMCAQMLVNSGICEPHSGRIVFQILPIEIIANPSSYYCGHLPLVMKELIFSIYDRCNLTLDSFQMYSPTYTLANVNGKVPLYSKSRLVNCGTKMAVTEPDRVIHVAYAFSNGILCACASDCVGEVFQLFNISACDEKAGPSEDTDCRDIFTRLWLEIIKICGHDGICWRIVLCRTGQFTSYEIDGIVYIIAC